MPYSTFTIEAAFFKIPKALIKGNGSRSEGPPMSKFCMDLDIKNDFRLILEAKGNRTFASVLPSTSSMERAVHQTYLFQLGSRSMTSEF